MFSFGAFAGGVIYPGADPTVEREPPPRPTPLTFPRYDDDPAFTTPRQPWQFESDTRPDLQAIFSEIRKQSDINAEHFAALNIAICPQPAPKEDILPRFVDFYPKFSVQEQADAATQASQPAQGEDSKPRKEHLARPTDAQQFFARLTELQIPNDVAFALLNKLPLPAWRGDGGKPPRIAQMRKLWLQLENVAQYWDDSLDEYFYNTSEEAGQHEETGGGGEEATINEDAVAERQIGGKRDQAPGLKDDEHALESPKRIRPDVTQQRWSDNEAATDSSRSEASDTDSSMEEFLFDSGDAKLEDVLARIPDGPAIGGFALARRPHHNTLPAVNIAAPPVMETVRDHPQTLRYRGRRLGAGAAMPDRFREDLLIAFSEAAAWPFGHTISLPRQPPIVVQLGTLRLPVRQTASMYRTSKDRAQQRAGYLIGPVLGLQARHEVHFQLNRDEGTHDAMSGSNATDGDELDQDQPIELAGPPPVAGSRERQNATQPRKSLLSRQLTREEKVRLDVMREIGSLLLLAQERHREGKEETIAGKGKWYTEKPRWGADRAEEFPKGRPADQAGATEGTSQNANDPATSGLTPTMNRTLQGFSPDYISKLRDGFGQNKSRAAVAPKVVPDSDDKYAGGMQQKKKRKSPLDLWAELRCGRGTWDPKTKYEAIGKNTGSDGGGFDDVFLLSSLNHHVSIVRLSVHGAYLDYLSSGIAPASDPQMENAAPDDALKETGMHWSIPRLVRSQWYDLLDVDQRCEAFRLLWGVVAYLSRDRPETTS